MITAMSLARRLYAASDTRPTRLHDELGARAPLSRVVRNLPRSVATTALRILFNRRSKRPWISYDGQAALARLLHRDSRVLEFGSGMSTAWYAARAGEVISIEDDPQWFKAVENQLRGLSNVALKFAADRDAYISAAPAGQFDLIMIDGSWRDACASFACEHLRPGGVIYLDNCDMNPGVLTGDLPAARRLLTNFAAANDLPVQEFTDFAPTQAFAQRGLMVGGSTS